MHKLTFYTYMQVVIKWIEKGCINYVAYILYIYIYIYIYIYANSNCPTPQSNHTNPYNS